MASPSKGKGVVIMFETAVEIAATAKKAWIVGVCLLIFVGLGTLIWVIGGREDDVFRRTSNEREYKNYTLRETV